MGLAANRTLQQNPHGLGTSLDIRGCQKRKDHHVGRRCSIALADLKIRGLWNLSSKWLPKEKTKRIQTRFASNRLALPIASVPKVAALPSILSLSARGGKHCCLVWPPPASYVSRFRQEQHTMIGKQVWVWVGLPGDQPGIIGFLLIPLQGQRKGVPLNRNTQPV